MFPKSIVVIGAGPGGEAAAKHAAERGAQVTVVERGQVGGVCLNRGCVPSKILLEGGRLMRQVRAAPFLQGANTVGVLWDRLQEKKRRTVDQFRKALEHRFLQLRVGVVEGEARFVSDHVVEVATPEGPRKIPFDAAVIATGSKPVFPPPFDARLDLILDSERALALAEVPPSLAVVGGGAVGLEFACLFRELGSSVTVIEKKPQILPGEESAVSRLLQKSFEKRGIAVFTDRTVTSAEPGPEGWRLVLSSGETVTAAHTLVCVGRRPSGEGLGLEEAKVFHDHGRIAVNQFLQTSQDHIYAVGDVNGLSLLAHAASAQGVIAIEHMAGGRRAYDNGLVPRCLYTWPEVASVGEWTHSASIKDVDLKSQRFFFQGSPKAIAAEEPEGFIQVLSDKKDGRLLGAQIVGPHATELIHVMALAIEGGMTRERLKDVVFAHPTLSEGLREALSR